MTLPAPGARAAGSPEELLQLLLNEALGRGEEGVRRLFQLSAERLRSRLGELDGFRRALTNDLYSPLLLGAPAPCGEVSVIGESARATLVAEQGGDNVRFVVGMAVVRVEGGAREWRITGLVREGVDL